MTATPGSPSPSPLVNDSSNYDNKAITNNNSNVRPTHHGKHVRAAVAGACAGAVAKTVVAPIERVKILMQLQHSLTSQTYLNKNPFQVASTIYRDEGLLAFWRGNFHNVLQQGGTSALNFMFMDYYKALAGNSVYASFLCGGLAGGTATTILYPIQFLRTRLAADVGTTGNRSYPNGMRDVLRATLRVDGVVGLYQGYGIALAGIFLYRSLHMGGYDAIKTVATNDLTWTEKICSSAVRFACRRNDLLSD
jgi:solute carrier family 25 (adenine nucleotide translocator) protein 4/5/6/31